MKVSAKAEHALHAMLYIAAKGENISTISEVAEQEQIPRDFLAKVLKELTLKGLLKSFKGINGGYKLGKAPQKISFLNIIEAMDGPLCIVSCADDTHSRGAKAKRKYCTAQIFWIPLQDKLKDAIGHMTLDNIHPL
jgi:Rrf2 family transcriptional regulator, iron-sulfur cluster assembly transcription factor